MTERSRKPKKGTISEEDISALLQRYAANTVLTLLREVAQFDGVKIDWNALVKKSKTGISNAREYQMLWRHLAYRHSLLERFDDGALPLDDDSDLEYELEAFPPVSSEASAEALACVKVLNASGLTSNSSQPNNVMVEAPLTINIPNGQLSKATSESLLPTSMRGMNITVPVSVQKHHIPAVPSAEPLDRNGVVNGANRAKRKRNAWTEAEDMELVAAVQKYGEGNWANILRSETSLKRTVYELSQRWKKIGTSNSATTKSTSGVQISEAQRATQIALNLALDPPVKNTFMNSGEGTISSQRTFAAKPSPNTQLGPSVKLQTTVNRPVKPDLSSDPVRAAAVAAGARIASQSDAAASLLKAAQAKNAIHIMPSVGSSVKSPVPGGAATKGLPTPPAPTHPTALSGGQRPALARAYPQSIQRNPATNVSSGPANTELQQRKEEPVNAGGIKRNEPTVAKVEVQEQRASNGRNEPVVPVKDEKASLPNEIKTKESSGENVKVPPKVEAAVLVGERNQGGEKANCVPTDEGENRCPVNVENEGKVPS